MFDVKKLYKKMGGILLVDGYYVLIGKLFWILSEFDLF